LVALWVWSTRGSITGTEREMRKNNVFPAFRKDEITHVELHGEKGDVVLDRPDAADAWFMNGERADSHAVDGLLGAFEFGTRIRTAPDDALGKLRVHGSMLMGRITYSFSLGDAAPVPAGAAYVKLDGEGTFVASSDLVKALLDDASTYRSRTVVPYLSIELAKMEIRDPGGKGFSIERVDDVAFRLPDANMRASRDGLDTVWQALAELRASSFLSDEDADAALKPEIIIHMQPKDGRLPGDLSIGGACPGHPEETVLVRKSPGRLSACVPGGLVARLKATPADLADKRLFITRLDEVESIRIAGAVMIDLARKGSGWTLRSPETRDLAADESDMATALVQSIVRAEGTFAPIAGGAFTSSSRVTVVRAESHAEETIETDGKVVHRLADVTASPIGSDLARKLRPSLVAIRGRAVWTPSIEGRDPVGLALDCDGVAQALSRERTWKYLSPAGLPADEAAATDVADAIARLRAESWVAEKDDGTFGFGKCTGALATGGEAGAHMAKVFFGRDASDGVYAKIEGQDPVFVAPRAARDAMTRLLVDRGALALDPKPFELKKDGKSIPIAAEAGAIDLRADDVVHFGPPKPDEGFTTLEILQDKKRIRIGHASLRRDQKMYFARIDGIDATFAVAKERIEPLLDRFGGSK
jgi:hypothetical protein